MQLRKKVQYLAKKRRASISLFYVINSSNGDAFVSSNHCEDVSVKHVHSEFILVHNCFSFVLFRPCDMHCGIYEITGFT